jgi:cystathionine gamma-lyase
MNDLKQDESGPQRGLGFAASAVPAGQRPDSAKGAITMPIYRTATYEQDDWGKDKEYTSGRIDNPARKALERCIASLENAEHSLAFASGLAACAMITHLLRPGDHILVGEHVYGGIYRLFENMDSRYQIQVSYVNTDDLVTVQQSIFSNTKMLWLESPANPLLKLVDLRALCKMAKDNHLISVVDNTFATPYFQQPLGLGADIVVHSTTRYLNGHCELIGGAIATSRSNLYEELKFLQNAFGTIPAPIDCFLMLRGIRTLAARMRQHAQSAQRVAEFLHTHPSILSLRYPGLASHPQHELAQRQMSGFGGIIACELEDLKAVDRLLKDLRVFTPAEIPGGPRSLVCHPSTMIHASMPKAVQIERGITEGWLRLSVGLEDPDDLIADLRRAIPHRTTSVRC